MHATPPPRASLPGRAFPLRFGTALSAQVTADVMTINPVLGVSVILVEKAYNQTQNFDAPVTTNFTGLRQTIVVTSYNTDPWSLCGSQDVLKSVQDGIIASLDNMMPSANLLSCVPSDGNVDFTVMVTYRGTQSDATALMTACSATPFSVCDQDAYTALCPAIWFATGRLGLPQQALCIKGGACPLPW